MSISIVKDKTPSTLNSLLGLLDKSSGQEVDEQTNPSITPFSPTHDPYNSKL